MRAVHLEPACTLLGPARSGRARGAHARPSRPARYYTTEVDTAGSMLPVSAGVFAARPNEASVTKRYFEARLPTFQQTIRDRLNMSRLLLFQGSLVPPHLVDVRVPDGHLGSWGVDYDDVRMSPTIERAIERATIQRATSGRPFYLEAHTEGMHQPWGIPVRGGVGGPGRVSKAFRAAAMEQAILWTRRQKRGCQAVRARGAGSACSTVPAEVYAGYLQRVHLVDRMIGDLAAALRGAGLAASTLLVLSGDHAYSAAHVHRQSHWDEQFHTPFILSDLAGDVLANYAPGGTIDDISSNVDWPATITDILGLLEGAKAKPLLSAGVGHSLRRRRPAHDPRRTFSASGADLVVRNATHTTLIGPSSTGPGFRVQTWDRRRDARQYGAPAVDVDRIVPSEPGWRSALLEPEREFVALGGRGPRPAREAEGSAAQPEDFYALSAISCSARQERAGRCRRARQCASQGVRLGDYYSPELCLAKARLHRGHPRSCEWVMWSRRNVSEGCRCCGTPPPGSDADAGLPAAFWDLWRTGWPSANSISCGGHSAPSCAECTLEGGDTYCNGDCRLQRQSGNGVCVPRRPRASTPPPRAWITRRRQGGEARATAVPVKRASR